MPNEPEQIVESGAAPSTPDAASTPPPSPPTPAPAGNEAGNWEREKRGLIAEAQRERRARQEYEQHMVALQAQHADAQRRIQALAGVSPRSREELEDEEVRAAFRAKFPAAAEITAEDIEELRAARQGRERVEQVEKTLWRNHGTKMIRDAQELIADRFGISELTEAQQRRIARDYVAFVEDNAEQGAVDRHEAGDKHFVNEFVKSFLSDFEEPLRKSVVTQETGFRRPIPSGKGRSVQPTVKKKLDYNNPKEVEDAMVQSYLDHGGGFGNQ